MPMPYKDFNWRPNDNSSLTNHRYDLEAEKWYKGFRNAENSNAPIPSFGGVLGQISPILMLPFLLVMWVFVLFLLVFRAFGIIIPILPGDILEARRRSAERDRIYRKKNYESRSSESSLADVIAYMRSPEYEDLIRRDSM